MRRGTGGQHRRFGFMICATAAAATIAVALPVPALAAPAAGCVGGSYEMEPNGADAICIKGAGFIKVKITCVQATTAEYYDREGPRVWSNAADPMIDGSRVYCDFPGDPMLSHTFELG